MKKITIYKDVEISSEVEIDIDPEEILDEIPILELSKYYNEKIGNSFKEVIIDDLVYLHLHGDINLVKIVKDNNLL